MKVALSSFVYQMGRTGISTYIHNLLQYLQASDHENIYEVLVPAPDAPFLPPPTANVHYRVTSSIFASPIPGILWHNTVLPRLAKERHYDLIHIPSYRRVPAIKNVPVIATVHDLAPLSMPEKYDMARTFYNRHIVPKLLAGCDHLIAVSETTRDDILRYVKIPEEKVSVIYSGIDRRVYRPLDQQLAKKRLQRCYGIDQPFLVYVSRLEHPGKNHVGLIRAFEKFKERNDSPHHLVLAGAEWPGAEVILERAKHSPVADQIHCLGFIPTEDIVALYSACDLMIHPSFFEGFGFPVAEAAACGAKVICSGSSSLKELATLGGLHTFDPQEPVEIREMIEKALQEGPDADRMIQFASMFDWTKTVHETRQLYTKVANA